jgi:hypothetical protein
MSSAATTATASPIIITSAASGHEDGQRHCQEPHFLIE